MIKVIYNKVCGRCVQSEPLTSGMVGQTIHFEYSHDFDGLAATAVFTDGANTVNVVNPGNECIIPHEVLTTVGAMVKVGIYAVKGDELVIPTIYAHIGVVLKGADPNGGISEDPTLPVWAQTQAMIGNLSELDTQAKENLVLAINEVKQTADSKQDIISDLEAIRTGAAKGATALQSVPNTYRTASEQDTIDSGKVDKVTGKGLSSNDYTDAAKAKVDALAPVATSGSYNDLADKPTIPAPVTEQTVSGWGFTKNTGTYSKPTGGIPKADLANDVQASLNKAETALQEHQSLAAYRTAEAQNIIDNTKQDKLIAGENITIAADGKTISATGGGVQSDWHQNDSTAADYVKNRPFYTGNPVETVLVEESTVSFADAGGLYQGQFLTTFEATVGETYAVNWDGTEYECVCSVFNSVPVLGNLSIPGAGSDTGEPFVMLVSNGKGLQIFTLDTSASHTFSISGFIAQNVQIPDKYISDTFRDVIIAGNPLKWSATDWTKYYDLFQGGKLLKINSHAGSDFEGYVLSMFYAAGVGSQISVITPTGGFFKLSSNSTTNEIYWAPVFNLDKLYFGYLQTGSGPNTSDREEYKRLEIAGGDLTFTTKTSAENPVKRKVVLEGDNVSAFTNDAGYLTSHQDISGKQDKLIAGENITIAADGKTISATGGGVQSDWHQNDSTAADYVKNRPFYTGNPVENVLVEENTVPFEGGGDLYMGTLPQVVPVIAGETYKVYWDSTAYECTCVNSEGMSVLGNLSIPGFGSDTGEPFVLAVNISEETTEIYTTDTSATHTISISGLVPEIVKIDKKYLPFDIPTKTSQLENDSGYLTLATLPKYGGEVV